MSETAFRTKVRCPVCGVQVERIGFLSIGGSWISSQKCDRCRYRWEAKSDSIDGVNESLSQGGDYGRFRLFEDGKEIKWAVCNGITVSGVIVGFVPPGVDADEVFGDQLPDEFKESKAWQKRYRRKQPFSHSHDSISHHRRYLVKVRRFSTANAEMKTVELKPWYYAPTAKKIEDNNTEDRDER